MDTVFVLQHVRPADPGACEDVKMIGIYRSKASALEAMARLCIQPGFVDHPALYNSDSDPQLQGFCLDEYELDMDNWVDGFAREA